MLENLNEIHFPEMDEGLEGQDESAVLELAEKGMELPAEAMNAMGDGPESAPDALQAEGARYDTSTPA